MTVEVGALKRARENAILVDSGLISVDLVDFRPQNMHFGDFSNGDISS